jgi:TolB-like protein/Tfp pilus assembly protein PilF
MGLVSELRRRNVFRMAVLYVVAAWLIMQVGEVLVTLAALPVWTGQAILVLLAVGFPIAVAFSWFYEITPEGISLEADVDPAESITHITGRRLDFLVISLLAAAVILFAYDKWWMGPPPEKSIAVLAFENMSGDPDQEYFSDGISEELLNLLAQIPGLTVISRPSAFSFKGKDVAIREIAKQLHAAHVLVGSVRRDGNRVRITAQLIEARSDSHLWSGTYDREPENIFALQDEISSAIVGALTERLGLEVEAIPRVITAANTEAHEAYLRGRHLVVQRTRDTVEGAVREFEKAIALDPDYALAHAELAIATLLLINGQYGDLTLSETITRAAPHAERAMALDPTLADAHAASGFLVMYQKSQEGSSVGAEEALIHFRQAIQINPNYSIVYTWMGILLGADLGRYDEGFDVRETALRLDPLSIPALSNYVGMLINRNRLDEAAWELEKLASIHPSFYASARGQLKSLGGNWAEAVLGNLDAWRINQDSSTQIDLSLRFAMLGLENEALAISESPLPAVMKILGKSEDAVTIAEARFAEDPVDLYIRSDLGLALAGNGDYARAQPMLEEMWQQSGGRVTSQLSAECTAALIVIRRDAGEEAKVGELVAAIRDNVRRYREAGITAAVDSFWDVNYEDGLAAYLSGERKRGIELIAKGVENGLYVPLSAAYLQTLYDDPGFTPIRAMQEDRQARERQKVLAVVCTDNPYAAVWQPADGTCGRYAAAGGN